MPVNNDTPTVGSGPADPYAQREAWLSFVRPAADNGKLEKIPTKKASTPYEAVVAQRQNYWLSRKTFGGWGDNYDRIFRKGTGPCSCGEAA